MNTATPYIRWSEPGLYPRGLLQAAPPPRELFVARVERAEHRAASVRKIGPHTAGAST